MCCVGPELQGESSSGCSHGDILPADPRVGLSGVHFRWETSVRLNGDRIIAYAPPAAFSIGFERTGALHIVEDGELELVLPAGERVECMGRGDVVLLPRGDPHQKRDAVGADAPARQPPRWLTGTFRIGSSEASQLLAGLPEAIILRGARDQALDGLEVAKRMLLFEMERPSQRFIHWGRDAPTRPQ